MEGYISKVFALDSINLLAGMPASCVDAVITDPMFGTKNGGRYDWGSDPAAGNPIKHWQYHRPFFEQCRRVVKPGGVIAWAQSILYRGHLDDWFGPEASWWWIVNWSNNFNFIPVVWVVMTREGGPIEHPKDLIVPVKREDYLSHKKVHPCPKPVEEMEFLVKNLSKPGDLILDPFCGVGSTLVAAEKLGRRWIGCDRSYDYCQEALNRIARYQALPRPGEG